MAYLDLPTRMKLSFNQSPILFFVCVFFFLNRYKQIWDKLRRNMMLKLVSSNGCYFSKIVDDLFLCPEFLIRGFPAINVWSLIGLFIDTSRGCHQIRSSQNRSNWKVQNKMHGSLHAQIDLFYSLEKFHLVFSISFYVKEKNLPAFEGEKTV